ncbi:uncharacterized protein Z520_01374 [Fonsecaea multimorphosa CBS 102226]|uniref:3-oxoacyl-[acyl-carrier protein] reductase n=1 Tax=Fonsecaea multimorphosa CBS 102226 TaxID=1442371 RepID=A0A0D2L1L5_9EURO|nr:uncharacterized protein Z520_01374 [Fonsecaea multimorphosa CBS 102226]KIY02909.1 hypothetical protein Z520_01374 [Fonsecaea multimorphosa CBS 102226]
MSTVTTPKRRLEQLTGQIAQPPIIDGGTYKGMPRVARRAGDSVGQRAQGKVVIITGCNSPLGMGRATAHQYARNGARAVYICDYMDDYLNLHVEEMNELYPEVAVHARKFDAGDEAGVKAVVAHALETYGRLDVFFANAANSGTWKEVWNMEVDEFERTIRTNLTSVFLAIKHAGPAMQVTSKDKPYSSGSIIATSSTAGLRSNGGSTDYSAAKAAVVSLVQTACFQYAGRNIRCNAIAPGMTHSGMTEPVFYGPARERGTLHKVGQLCPLRRGAVADEIARVALFLGSDEASYVNGQVWAVDGGLSSGLPYKLGNMA